ncbi:multidrug effflux MFS transporter [Pseudokineococcus marinus]|uniref:Multidrug effflux MFS transporter n=1 Tax=Pseudokineococcus marinus TaxID=351215 RepID=A0A849BP59_9ACTN|nr:multidrug effflux MFS transporter [Pseudokineococcus marinus]NNH22612.1 multidrug effflux MFS transporter [Pseudokineococcus marinus]
MSKTVPDAVAATRPTGATAVRVGVWFAASLALVTVLGPAGTDMYLSSLPDIASQLGVGAGQVQLTLTVYLLAMGLGQLIFGPLIDAWGRRWPLVAGVAMFVVASLWAGSAGSLGVFLAARVVHGLAAALTLVVALSMVRDVAKGARAAQLFALLMTIEGLAPVLAPTVGGILDARFGWRAVFLALAAMGAVALVNTLVSLRESLPHDQRSPLRAGGVVRTYRRVLVDRAFLVPALALATVFFVLFGYIAGATFVYQESFGLAPDVFGLVFGATGVAVMLGAITAGRTVSRYGTVRVSVWGVGLLSAGTVVALVTAAAGVGLVGIVAGMAIALFGVGIAESTLMALAMSSQSTGLGSTAAVLGALQLGIASAATPLAGSLAAAGPVPWVALLVAASVVALALTRTAARQAPEGLTAMAAH